MNKPVLKVFLLLLILILPGHLFAVRNYQPRSINPLHEHWRWKQYPEMNTRGIRCMAESPSNEMWFGVDKGVMRYDGLDWTLYTPKDGLRGNPVISLIIARDGSIYAGSESGLSRFDGDNWQSLFPADSSGNFSVRSICELPDGTILCGLDIGLLHLNNGVSTLYTGADQKHALQADLPGTNIIAVDPSYQIRGQFWVDDVFLDRDNVIWLGVGYENGLSGKLLNGTYHPGRSSAIDLSLRLAEEESHQFYNGIRIAQTRDRRIWAITQQQDHGLRYFDGKKTSYKRLSDQFGDDNIYCSLIQTEDGTIWIGGLGRLFAYKNGRWFLYRSPDVPVPPSNRLLLLEGHDGSIWIAGKRNEVFQLDYTTSTWVTYQGLNFACTGADGREWFLSSENRIVCHDGKKWFSYGIEDGLMEHPDILVMTRSGRLWAGGSHQALSATAYFDGTRWHGQVYPHLSWGIDFRSMFEDRDGALWVGGAVDIQRQKGQLGGILKYPDPENDPQKVIHYTLPQTEVSVYGIGQTRDGRMWIAGINGCWLDGENWRIIDNPPELRNHSDAICTDPNGDLWYGSRNYGIFHYNGQSWKQYTVEDGLLSNSIKSIYVESDSSVWVATDKDICRFDGNTWTTGIFPADLTILHEGGDLKPGKKGQIWINKSSRNWHRRVLNHSDKQAAPDVWTVRFNRDLMPPETRITMYEQKVYQPGNTIISWRGVDRWKNTPDEQIQYSYQMDNDAWSKFSGKTSHIFLELATGQHIFRVRARDRDFNIDPTPVQVQFDVASPFYLQPAFLIPVILLTILSIVLEIRVIGQNKKLQTAKKETDNILENVDEGLFLLNSSFEIGNQYSRELETTFEQEHLEKVRFLDLISEHISGHIIETINDYLDVAFNSDTHETVLDDLNPLSDIRMNFGGKRNKYLNFKFRKIDTGSGKTDHMIVTVNDITEAKLLEERLKASEEQSERQMNWLLSLLQVDPKLLQEFLVEVQNELNSVREILGRLKDSENMQELLKQIYRSIHMIKGNASMLTLNFFTDQAHALEDDIVALQQQDAPGTEDLQLLQTGVEQIQESINTASGLLDRISQIHSQMRLKRSHENKMMLQSFKNLVAQIGKDSCKQIELNVKKFSLNDIPYEKQLIVKDVMVQLLRNAVAHGIESPEDRKASGKKASGSIEISSFKSKNKFGFAVRDDGRGLQIDKIRERAIQIGQWSADEIATWSENRMIDTIFVSGISTSEKADTLSGRGVGLDLVRDKLKEAGGSINIKFEPAKYCEFIVEIPV